MTSSKVFERPLSADGRFVRLRHTKSHKRTPEIDAENPAVISGPISPQRG
jgi:hypothetical protein